MKSLSILCYVVAGFFIYGVGLMAFLDVEHIAHGLSETRLSNA